MKALILGISGQDGAYLAKELVSRDVNVTGITRQSGLSSLNNLKRLRVRGNIDIVSLDSYRTGTLKDVLVGCGPDVIYNLSGPSSVGYSFERPHEAFKDIVGLTSEILEVLRTELPSTRLYHASSSECFGNTPAEGASEDCPFMPQSPYAVAKAAAHWLVKSYRDSYGLFAVNGILFNHESPLRTESFVTGKIVNAAARIKMGSEEKLRLGRTNMRRDWGWAPDYVGAMILMLESLRPDDYVIATGKTTSLQEFTEKTFSYFDLDWQDHVLRDEDLYRPNDIGYSRGKPHKAKKELGWEAKTNVEGLVAKMCDHALARVREETRSG